MPLWPCFVQFLPSIKFVAAWLEILFNEINIMTIVLLLCPWVSNNENSKLMKRSRYLLAEILNFLVFYVFPHEVIQVNNWDIFYGLDILNTILSCPYSIHYYLILFHLVLIRFFIYFLWLFSLIFIRFFVIFLLLFYLKLI